MTFNFVEKVFNIGGSDVPSPLQFYKRGFNLGGSSQPSWQDIILSGTTALTLTNALANGLNYLKLFGGTEQRNLPSEYTQVEYLESSGGQKINTGLAGNDNYTIRAKFYDFGGGANCVVSGSDSRYGTNYIGRVSGSGSSYRMLLSNKKSSDITASIGLHTVEVTPQKITFDGTDYSWSADNNSTGQYLYLFYGYYSSELTARMRLYYYQVELDGVILRNFIPAKRNSDNVLGMYDTVTDTFFTNAGTGTFTAGAAVTAPSPDTPMDIVCNNGVLKVNKNLYSTEYHDEALSQSDGVTTTSNTGVNVSTKVDCRTIKSFKITTVSPQGSFRIFKYGADNTFINATSTANTGNIITLEANVGFFRIQYNYTSAGTDTQNILIYNSTYNLNEIYTDGTQEVVTDSLGNTASAERLLAVGTYKDTQEVISGSVTRQIGIKVFDGTEDWFLHATGAMGLAVPHPQGDNNLFGYCSHFLGVQSSIPIENLQIGQFKMTSTSNNIYFKTEYDTVASWKQYLASQYNAGTPVIIVYQLATPTTETVTGQPLTTQAGTNIVEITQASINNLGLEVSYKATV